MENRKISGPILAALAVGLIAGWLVGTSQPSRSLVSSSSMLSESKPHVLQTEMRTLWDDHVVWTRLYIVSAVNNLDDKDATLERLMKNQDDIGNIMKLYYGDSAGKQITELLREHISLSGAVVAAAVSKDEAQLASADKKWQDNGNKIADFLAQTNNQWSKESMRAMFKEHLDLTRQEAVDIIAKKPAESVADYDRVRESMLTMSDALTTGIIKQFPEKFK